MKRLLVMTGVALSVASSAFSEERMIDATKVFPMLDKLYAVPAADRSKIVAVYSIKTKDGRPVAPLTLVVGAKRTPLVVAADGRVERLPGPADLAAHAQVATDAPKGAFSVGVSLVTAIKPAAELDPAECALAIAQANAAIQKAAGMMAMLAPNVKATTFIGAGSGVAVLTDGRIVPLPLIKGVPAYNPDAVKNAKTLRLAKAPTLVSLE